MKRDPKGPPELKTKEALGPGWQSLDRKKTPVRPWTIGLDQKSPESAPVQEQDGAVQQIQIDKIIPDPHQPRRIFSQKTIADLARSIKEVGLLEPILIRPTKDGNYSIIAGERRWRACKSLNHVHIKAIVREATTTEAFKLSIVENLIREQLNIIEKALGFKELLNQKIYQNQSLMATDLGISRTSVVKTLRLLERLDEHAINYYLENYDHLTEGHLHAAMRAPVKDQCAVLTRIKDEGWSVQQTRQHVTVTYASSQRSNHFDLKKKRLDWFDLGIRVRPTMNKAEIEELIGTLEQTIQRLETLAKTKN